MVGLGHALCQRHTVVSAFDCDWPICLFGYCVSLQVFLWYGWRLAYLQEGNEGWVSIFDQVRGIGARLKWDAEKFPYLWFWQERFSPGFPFYGRAEITGLEPASCHPNEALAGASKSGRSTFIPVNEKIYFNLDLEII